MAMKRRQRARRVVAEDAPGTRIDDAISARPAITIEIGEVVLRGIDVGDRGALAAALERELTSVLGDGETTRIFRAGTRARIDGGTISFEGNRSAPALGRQIAQAVQRSLIESSARAAKVSKH